MSDTPETDEQTFTFATAAVNLPPPDYKMVRAGFAQKLERERNAYQTALREMVAAKGRYNTQTAMERLIALLPENQTHES